MLIWFISRLSLSHWKLNIGISFRKFSLRRTLTLALTVLKCDFFVGLFDGFPWSGWRLEQNGWSECISPTVTAVTSPSCPPLSCSCQRPPPWACSQPRSRRRGRWPCSPPGWSLQHQQRQHQQQHQQHQHKNYKYRKRWRPTRWWPGWCEAGGVSLHGNLQGENEKYLFLHILHIYIIYFIGFIFHWLSIVCQ